MLSSGGKRSDDKVAPTPIPLKKVIILGFILSANNTSIWMIFSFLPFMVQNYFPELTKEELGYRAGLLGSAFSAGSLFGNIGWGMISDRLGRRPALLMGLIGTTVCATGFGFAPTFVFAVCTRFMWGLLNGNIGVAKTYLGEISDDSNAAKGMALFGVIGGFGRTIGPIIGGFLSSPAVAYPTIFAGTIFDKYPYALPSIVISAYCFIVFLVSFWLLPETLPPEKVASVCCNIGIGETNRGYLLLQGKDDGRTNTTDIELTSVSSDNNHEYGYEDDECSPLAENDKSFKIKEEMTGNNDPKKSLTFSDKVTVKVIDEADISFKQLKSILEDEQPVKVVPLRETTISPLFAAYNFNRGDMNVNQYSNGSDMIVTAEPNYSQKIMKLLFQRSVFISTLMYGTNALVSIVVNEVFPLWVVTSKRQGGFEFNAHQIGVTTMIGGVFAVILQVTLYPKLVDSFGVLNVIKLGIFFFAVGCALTPSISLITSLHSEIVEWIMITLSQLVLGVTSTWVLISVFVLINNSCYSHQRATVNGIGQTFASLGRLCGPYFGAVLFAWSETSNHHWPINYYFVFYLLVVISVGNWCLVSMLPYSIQRRKREAVVRTEEQVDECNSRMVQSQPSTKKKTVSRSPIEADVSDKDPEIGGALDYCHTTIK